MDSQDKKDDSIAFYTLKYKNIHGDSFGCLLNRIYVLVNIKKKKSFQEMIFLKVYRKDS